MSRPFLILGVVFAALLALLWLSGGLAGVERQAIEAQRWVQSALAGAIRQLRADRAGALAGLLGLSFAYGVFHAVGPGHGKMLIGGYGMATRVRLWPLAVIAILSSLAQATVAVALVYAGIALFGWTRDRLIDTTDQVTAPVSYAILALIGVWLMVRGWRGLRRGQADGEAATSGPKAVGTHHDHAHGDHAHDHDHNHAHDHVHDAHCGHVHLPTPAQVSRVTGWRDALALIAGVAVRPCTGALFVLILTWQMGIGAGGILAAYAMGLGTALVTVGVAAMAVWAREGAFASLPARAISRAAPVLEITVGAVVALVAVRLFGAAI
jgi:ABC-type nickel/cobalt efflux system permease component RcnA